MSTSANDLKSPIEEADEFFYKMLDSETPYLTKIRVKAAYERQQEETARMNKFLNPIRANTWMGKSDGYQEVSIIGDDMAVVKYYDKGKDMPTYYYGAILNIPSEGSEEHTTVTLTQNAYKTFDEAILGCLCIKYSNESFYSALAKLLW